MRRYLLAPLLLSAVTCLAQEPPASEEELLRLADELTALQDEDANDESRYENLLQTMSVAVDLNKASAEELSALHVLSPRQVEALIRYRTTYGPLASIYELQAIAELDLATIHKLLPRVMVTDPQSVIGRSLWQRALFEKNHYLITRYERTLEKKDGYRGGDAASTFKGSPGKFYTRFRSGIPGDYSVGFTAEKDAGEQFRWNGTARQYGFDFLSCHAQIRNKGRLKDLVIGDYQCQFGQGLVLGGAFGLGKGAETITTAKKNNIGLMPYTSANESGFYRGVATTLQVSRYLYITALYSALRRNGSDEADSAGNTTISSLQSTGLHRSEDELKDRKAVLEKNYAAVLSYRGANLDAGVIFHGIHFSDAVQRNPSAYNQFVFRGKSNLSAGTFVNYTHHNFNFFSEAARSQNGGTAVLTGMLASLHPKFDLSLVFRKYDTHYHTFYANAFAENTQAQNETGLYWGWKYTWNRRYNLCGYMDLFRFPWLGFRRYAPAYGHEWLLKFSYQPDRKTVMFVQAREEKKVRNHGEAGNLYLADHGIRRNYWVVLNYTAGEKLKLRTRAQFNTYALQRSTTKGLVLLQDVSYALGRFQCSARHAVFETDDYENRNYVYENDAWMAFSLPAYDGIGVRNYVLLQYKVNKMISLWVRYARTRYIDRTESGSGADRIAGNTRKDVKFQALIRF